MIKKSIITRKPKLLTQVNVNLVVLFLIVALMPLTVYLVSQQQDIRQRAQGGAEFVVSPNTERVGPGQSLALAINVKSNSQPINSVQLNITYPQEKLDVANVDTKNSSFDIQNEYIAGSGLVKIARGVQIPVTGENHVATIVFNAKQDAEAQDVKIIPGSSILRSSDNTNIYSGNVFETQTAPKESVGDKLLTANSEFWDYVYTTFFPSLFRVFQER